jgi:hypothetical protein
MRTLLDRCTPTLILPPRSDVPDAVPRALHPQWVPLMLFTPDDDFHDDARTWDLPDCAVALLARAGSWSARNQRDGFVPTAMLARFSSDPVPATEELTRRGLWRRSRRGYQFTDWPHWGETRESAEEKQAEADRRKELAAERQRRKRAKARAHTGAPKVTPVTRDNAPGLPEPVPASRGRHAAVTQPERTSKKKPQVKASAVTRDVSVTGSVTPPSDDLDFDFDLGSGQSVSHQVEDRNAGAREKPELVAAVADAISAKTGHVPTDGQALVVIGTVRKRAKKAGKVIRDPIRYIPVAVTNEPDLYAGLLYGDPPPLAEILAGPPSPVPPGYEPSELHEFDLNVSTGACQCERPRGNWRHQPPATEARTA